MADATITITHGAQSASFTVPEAAVQRITPMVLAEYRQHHPGADPTPLQMFLAGLWHHLRVDVLRFEQQSYTPDPIDMGQAPEGLK